MRKAVLFLMTACMSAFAANARISYELSVKGALARVVFKVVDQDGVAVRGAKIWGGFSANSPKDSVLVDGVTDADGEFVAQGVCNEFLRVDITKEGYYHSEEKVHFWRSKADPIVVDGRWRPYGETRTVVLKRIKNPWAVKVLTGEQCHRRIPKFGEWIGFDFQCGDWVQPYGKGVSKDMLARFTSTVRRRHRDFTHVMEVSFTNNPHAGFYRMKKDMSSDLKSEYSANPDAVYSSGLTYVQESGPGKPRRWDFLGDDSYLVFRTRTRVDDKGRLAGAHYGKIYGYWCSDDAVMSFCGGCFGLVENDLNIEGDRPLLDAIKNYGRKE